jgi:hypothetical protein
LPDITTTRCPQGHGITSSADRGTNGYCRECKRHDDRERRLHTKATLDVVRAFESVGVQFQRNGVPESPAAVVRQLIATDVETFK